MPLPGENSVRNVALRKQAATSPVRVQANAMFQRGLTDQAYRESFDIPKWTDRACYVYVRGERLRNKPRQSGKPVFSDRQITATRRKHYGRKGAGDHIVDGVPVTERGDWVVDGFPLHSWNRSGGVITPAVFARPVFMKTEEMQRSNAIWAKQIQQTAEVTKLGVPNFEVAMGGGKRPPGKLLYAKRIARAGDNRTKVIEIYMELAPRAPVRDACWDLPADLKIPRYRGNRPRAPIWGVLPPDKLPAELLDRPLADGKDPASRAAWQAARHLAINPQLPKAEVDRLQAIISAADLSEEEMEDVAGLVAKPSKPVAVDPSGPPRGQGGPPISIEEAERL